MHWRLPEILEERGLTAYRLAAMMREMGYRMTVRGAYRLADSQHELRRLDLDTLNAVCAALSLAPGDLLEYVSDKPKRRRG